MVSRMGSRIGSAMPLASAELAVELAEEVGDCATVDATSENKAARHVRSRQGDNMVMD